MRRPNDVASRLADPQGLACWRRETVQRRQITTKRVACALHGNACARQCCRAKTFLERGIYSHFTDPVSSFPDGRDPCIRAECLRDVPALSPKGDRIYLRDAARPPGNRCKPRQTGNGMELAVWEHGEACSLAPLIASPLLEGIAGRHRSVAPTIESPEVQIMKVTKCPNCVAAGIDTEINATKTSAPIAPTDPTSSSRSAALLHQE